MKRSLIIILFTILAFSGQDLLARDKDNSTGDTLVVVWTSGDIEVAEKMVFMYVYNSRKAGWFDEVIFIVWGPSAKLLSENEMLQEYISKMKEAGIKLEACIACANMYGVARALAEMDIDVKGMGKVLSDYLKRGYRVMTY